MSGLEVLRRELALPAEWMLGAGGLVRWHPAHPAQIDRPGFRDAAMVGSAAIEPVFAISLLDPTGRPIELAADSRQWNPARLELKYRLPEVLLTERRTVLSLDAFVSQWTMTHAEPIARHFWIVLWTRRPHRGGESLLSDIEANPQGISFQESRRTEEGDVRWGCALGANFDADSWSVNGAEPSSGPLCWRNTPLFDLMTPGGLPGHSTGADCGAGEVYFALAYPVEIAPGERLILHFAAAFASEVENARANLEQAVSLVDPIQTSEEEWINWFEEAPTFGCSDEKIQRAYWYRWAHRRIHGRGDGPGEAPASAAAALDVSWHGSELSHAELRSLLARSDEELDDLPIALAARRTLALHPDAALERSAIERLGLYARSRLGSGPVPSAPPPDPWRRQWREQPRLPSLRRSALLYDLCTWLSRRETLLPAERLGWRQHAERLARSIETHFWDETAGFYLQEVPAREGRRRARTACGFLALLLGEGRRREMFERLCDPDAFWTALPVPTLARDDRDFNADGQWQNQRLDQPMHGRCWPAATSLVLDALGRSIETAPPLERQALAELLRRVVDGGFEDGDPRRPIVREHFHPLSGRAAHFRGPDRDAEDWLIDHILRFVAGVRPDESGHVLIDPLPLRLEWFSVSRILIGDHELDVAWDHRTGLSVRIDDEPAGHSPVGKALSILLPDLCPAE